LPFRIWIVVVIVALTCSFVTRITHWKYVAASGMPEKRLLRATMNDDLPALESSWARSDDSERGQALITAAMMGHEAIVQRLLELGVDPNVRTIGGSTALMLAAVTPPQLEIARELLQAGADADARDDSGWTALKLAERDGNGEMVQLLKQSSDRFTYRRRTSS
jgi:hypothetical protein